MIFYCMLLMFLGGGINTQGSNLFSTQIASANGWEYAEILPFFTYAGWIAIVVSIFTGQWIMKKGCKLVNVFFLLVGSCGMFLFGIAHSKKIFALAVILTVCSLVVYSNLIPNTLMNLWFPKTKAIALGWATMGFPLVSILFPRMFLEIMEECGVKYGFFLFGGVLAMLGILTMLVIKELPEEAGAFPDNNRSITRKQLDEAIAQKKNYRSDWTIRRLLRNKTMWLVGLSMGLLWMVVVGIAGQWIPRTISLGYSKSFAINLLMLNGAVGLVASYVWGYIDQKFGTKKACILYGCFYLFEIVCLIYLTSKTAMYFVAVVAGIGTGGVANLLPSLIGTIWGRWDFPSVNRVLNPITNFLKGSASLVAAFSLKHLSGYNGMYVLFFVCTAIAIIMLFILDDTMVGKKN